MMIVTRICSAVVRRRWEVRRRDVCMWHHYSVGTDDRATI